MFSATCRSRAKPAAQIAVSAAIHGQPALRSCLEGVRHHPCWASAALAMYLVDPCAAAGDVRSILAQEGLPAGQILRRAASAVNELTTRSAPVRQRVPPWPRRYRCQVVALFANQSSGLPCRRATPAPCKFSTAAGKRCRAAHWPRPIGPSAEALPGAAGSSALLQLSSTSWPPWRRRNACGLRPDRGGTITRWWR